MEGRWMRRKDGDHDRKGDGDVVMVMIDVYDMIRHDETKVFEQTASVGFLSFFSGYTFF